MTVQQLTLKHNFFSAIYRAQKSLEERIRRLYTVAAYWWRLAIEKQPEFAASDASLTALLAIRSDLVTSTAASFISRVSLV